MSARRAGAAAATVVLALALVPWSGSPVYRLAGGSGDGPDPQFDVPLQGVAELRRSAASSPDGSYFLDARRASPLAQGNAKAAGQLYLGRNLPLQDPARAEYVLRLRGLRLEFRPAR